MFKNFLRNAFTAKTEKNRIDEYLADSADLVDLENRIRLMDRGQAPWQIQSSQSLRGWS